MEKEFLKLSGSVENIIFQSKDSGFTVLDLSTNGEMISVVGQLLGVEVGEELLLTGFYDNHKTYGIQFKAQMYERSLPATESAIIKYLSSGVIKGIGGAMAKRIVEMFGKETFEIIEKTPEKLKDIKGITEKKIVTISQNFKEIFGIRALMNFLSVHSINPYQSVEIYKKWGALAYDLIHQNPYILVNADVFIDFSVIDSIAKTQSIPNDSPKRIAAALTYLLSHNTNNGFTCLPRKKLVPKTAQLLQVENENVDDVLDEMVQENQLYSKTTSLELIYLPIFYNSQKYIAARLKLMLTASLKVMDNVEETIRKIEDEQKIVYAGLQKKAIVQAVKNDVFILTGGPGTGKTTTLNGIIDVLTQQGKEVSIAAPTGRAAKRIAEVTGREAKTIHRLLEVALGYAKTGKLEFVHNEQNPLEYDVVIIDEMSMVDTLLFDSLLRAMKPSAKLVMVGDFHQLPSVGAGNILHDLIESDTIPMVELDQIFRQAAESLIITNAHAIVNGEMPELSIKNKDFFFMGQTNPEKVSDTILDLCSFRLPKTYGFSSLDDIQVLCPQRKGELGIVELNKKLQARINPKQGKFSEFQNGLYSFRVGDKVMQTRNNYDIEWKKNEVTEISTTSTSGTGIFNGDIGIIKMIDKGSSTIAIDFDGRLAYYTFEIANELELAYAITVHKSQGCEFEAIILPILGGYDKLYFRNLLYTAVTRARQILIIIGSKNRVNFMVSNNLKMLRYTGMKEMLQESVFEDE